MKELKKMNLNELNSLSRKEMKNIMAGSGGSVGACTSYSNGTACTCQGQNPQQNHMEPCCDGLYPNAYGVCLPL